MAFSIANQLRIPRLALMAQAAPAPEATVAAPCAASLPAPVAPGAAPAPGDLAQRPPMDPARVIGSGWLMRVMTCSDSNFG